MEIKSTLVVVNEGDVESRSGVTTGQTIKSIIGNAERPTDRIRIALATFEVGTVEQLHWHAIEAFIFCGLGPSDGARL